MTLKKTSIFLFVFAFISIITLYSTRSILTNNLDDIYLKQILFYFLGLFIFFSWKNNRLIFKNVTILYVISCLSLLSLLLFTVPINNSKCWFIIPLFGTIQPSEFVKIILVVMTAVILTKETNHKLLKVFLIFLIPAILTYLEPDTGLIIIYMIGIMGSLFCYFRKYKFLLFTIIIFLLISLIIIYIYHNHQDLLLKIFGDSILSRVNRIINWRKQDGYQLNNALISMGSNGMNLSFNKINTYFPEAHTDFIFAAFASSFGYFYTVIFLFVILLFDLFLLNIARREKNETNKIMIVGLISMIIYEQIQNIGMNIGMLPITGITLPFISYGGSSLISSIVILTIIKNCQGKKEFSPF